jgi:hypothetical protein
MSLVPVLSQMEQVHALPLCVLNTHFEYCILLHVLKTCVNFSSPIHGTCRIQFVRLYLIALTLFSEKQKLCVVLYYPVTYCPSFPDIFLRNWY